MAYKEDMMITKRMGRIMINSAFILHSCSDNFFSVFNSSYYMQSKLMTIIRNITSINSVNLKKKYR